MSSFHERQKSLFNHLNEAEKQHDFSRRNASNVTKSTSHVSPEIDKQSYRRIKSEMKLFRGKESIFKRPEAPISRCLPVKTVPDYIKNPKKWVHYSLADVTPDQMSDATNTATALALLKKLENTEELKDEMKIDNDTEEEVFKKPTFLLSATVKRQPTTENKITFKSSKVIMPEYVVGKTERKIKRNKDIKKGENANIELKLHHLYDEED